MNRYHRVRQALLCAVSVASIAACTWLIPGIALANNNAGLVTIPLQMTKNIDATANLYVMIFGEINHDNGKGFPVGSNVYVTDVQGDVAITPAIPATMPVSLSLNLGMGTNNTITLPKLSAVRIYSSIGAPLWCTPGT